MDRWPVGVFVVIVGAIWLYAEWRDHRKPPNGGKQ